MDLSDVHSVTWCLSYKRMHTFIMGTNLALAESVTDFIGGCQIGIQASPSWGKDCLWLSTVECVSFCFWCFVFFNNLHLLHLQCTWPGLVADCCCGTFFFSTVFVFTQRFSSFYFACFWWWQHLYPIFLCIAPMTPTKLLGFLAVILCGQQTFLLSAVFWKTFLCICFIRISTG